MRNGHLIYQSIADAITPVDVETITIDKWYQFQENPILRKSLTGAILAGSFFFFNTVSLEANAKVPDWHPQTNQPHRLVSKLPRQNTGEFRFEVPRTILLTDWFQETKQPYFTKRREVNTGESRFELPRSLFITDWSAEIPDQNTVRKLIRQTGGEV